MRKRAHQAQARRSIAAWGNLAVLGLPSIGKANPSQKPSQSAPRDWFQELMPANLMLGICRPRRSLLRIGQIRAPNYAQSENACMVSQYPRSSNWQLANDYRLQVVPQGTPAPALPAKHGFDMDFSRMPILAHIQQHSCSFVNRARYALRPIHTRALDLTLRWGIRGTSWLRGGRCRLGWTFLTGSSCAFMGDAWHGRNSRWRH